MAEESLLGNLRITIETHAEMASYLVLLLATLGMWTLWEALKLCLPITFMSFAISLAPTW